MLSKGSDLFMFEGELFKLKQAWINQDMNIDNWNKLMDEGEKLLRKYDFDNEAMGYYCFQEFATFVDFMSKKSGGKFEDASRKGLFV